MTRRFVGRYGQPVTDPESIEGREMLVQLHRLTTVNAKKGRIWPYCVRVSELAKASKLTPERVMEIMRRYGEPWLLGWIEEGADWWVYQDGE